MVRVRTLQRVTVPPSLLPDASPAATHSHRVAAHFADNGTDCNVYLASGLDVYCIKMELKEIGADAGKEGLLIPVDSEVVRAWQVEQCPHRAEIQGIALIPSSSDDGFILGSVDAYGRFIVTSLNSDIPGSSYTAGPQDAGVGEGWWAGIVFNRNVPSLLSIWDLRQAERGGCVQRMLGAFTGDSLNAIACSSEGLVAVGGAERVVMVMDPLKWTPRSRWTGCLKYEVTGLSFSAVDPGLIYVHGLDYEVVCAPWNREKTGGSNTPAFSFRGDSRWLGFDKVGVKLAQFTLVMWMAAQIFRPPQVEENINATAGAEIYLLFAMKPIAR